MDGAVFAAARGEVRALVRVLFGGFLVNVAAQARRFVRPQSAVAVHGRAGQDFRDNFGEEYHFLHAEVGNGHVHVDVRAVGHRRDVARPVPRGFDLERLT